MTTVIQYQDVDITMKKDVNGDVSVVTNDDSINQSIGVIINTLKGEQLWNPRFGSNIKRYIFEKISAVTAQLIKKDIRVSLGNFEPRIRVVDVFVAGDEDKYQYNVSITYEVLSLNTLSTTSIVIQVG